MELFKFRIWCVTEQEYFDVWSETEPTTCPNNNTHQIDPDRIMVIDSIVEPPKDRSGKPRVHQTSRPLGTATTYTGAGDDPNNPLDVGGGVEFVFRHNIGDDAKQYYYFDLNVIQNRTWIHEGYIIWKDCLYDTITADIVPTVVTYQPGTNTMFNLYNGYLIVPANGDGTIEVTSDLTLYRGGLVQMPLNDLGERPTAFWNATWNPDTQRFENITPAPLGDGEFNIFAAEVVLYRIFNRVPLLNYGFEMMQSSDVSEIGHGMRFKVTTETCLHDGDHAWSCSCILTLHRERTI